MAFVLQNEPNPLMGRMQADYSSTSAIVHNQQPKETIRRTGLYARKSFLVMSSRSAHRRT